MLGKRETLKSVAQLNHDAVACLKISKKCVTNKCGTNKKGIVVT
jgi:hypothetical protein